MEELSHTQTSLIQLARVGQINRLSWFNSLEMRGSIADTGEIVNWHCSSQEESSKESEEEEYHLQSPQHLDYCGAEM